jgi:hypothetical protein
MRGLFPAGATTYLLFKLDTSPTNILTRCYRKLLTRLQSVWGVDYLSTSVLEVKNAGSPTSISFHAFYFRSNYLINHGVYGVHVRVWETTLFHLFSIQFRHKNIDLKVTLQARWRRHTYHTVLLSFPGHLDLHYVA